MVTRVALKEQLEDLIAAAGPLDPAAVFVGLFTAWPGEDEGLTVADLTEPTYTGYARQAVTSWSEVANHPEGGVHVLGAGKSFSPTADSAGNIIIGAFYADALNAGVLLKAELFEEPFTLAAEDDLVVVVPEWRLPADADYGTPRLVS